MPTRRVAPPGSATSMQMLGWFLVCLSACELPGDTSPTTGHDTPLVGAPSFSVTTGVTETRIDPPDTNWGNVGFGINDVGDVVGWYFSDYAESAQILFRWNSGGGLDSLGTCATNVPPSGFYSGYDAAAINDAGHVGGCGTFFSGLPPGVPLPTLGGSRTWIYDINNNDEVVGGSYSASGEWRPFLWSASTELIHDLGTLPGGTQGEAYGINDVGQVVGWHYVNGTWHAFIGTQAGGIDTIPGLYSTQSYSEAYAINSSGKVVGFADPMGGFVWDPVGGFQTLGMAPGQPVVPPNRIQGTDINDNGDVTGLADGKPAFWPGDALDQGVIISTASQDQAFRLNNNRQVVGVTWRYNVSLHWPIRAMRWDVTLSNTSTGSSVAVTPIDETTGQQPVTLTFDNVTTAGETTVASFVCGSPAPPFNLGTTDTCYDISTTATFTGAVEVCIHYTGVDPVDKPLLTVLHYDDGIMMWEDVTTTNNTVDDIICGAVTSLSPFLVAVPTPEWTLQQILDDVLALQDLNGNVGGALATKLENVIAKIEQGNEGPAINQLEAFINQLEGLVNAGQLDPADGELLIDLAQSVIDQLT